MKDVIDVMELQREKSRRIQSLDYRKLDFAGGFTPARFIFECGIKLNGQPLTLATAAILMHRFFKEVEPANYDCYLIAAASLYLGGKVKDDQLKIRDIINVTHNTLHRTSTPLTIGEEYWNMRDAIVQAELLIMRVLKFEVSIVHPHKYMLHYLRSLQGVMSKDMWTTTPLARTAAAFLQDFHHDASILEFEARHVAIACISLSMQCYGVRVPMIASALEEAGSSSGAAAAADVEETWYSMFVKDLSRDTHWAIMEKLMEVCNREPDQ